MLLYGFFLETRASNEMEWPEEKEDCCPGVPVFKRVPLGRTYFKINP